MDPMKINKLVGPRPVREAEIHPTAVVHPSAKLSHNVKIGPHAVIGPDVVIGPDCNIGSCQFAGQFIGNQNISQFSLHIGRNWVVVIFEKQVTKVNFSVSM